MNVVKSTGAIVVIVTEMTRKDSQIERLERRKVRNVQNTIVTETLRTRRSKKQEKRMNPAIRLRLPQLTIARRLPRSPARLLLQKVTPRCPSVTLTTSSRKVRYVKFCPSVYHGLCY